MLKSHQNATIYHNLVIGAIQSDITPYHYNEHWAALEGSMESLSNMIAVHTDQKKDQSLWLKMLKISSHSPKWFGGPCSMFATFTSWSSISPSHWLLDRVLMPHPNSCWLRKHIVLMDTRSFSLSPSPL
ncbi:unnamed protein product [Caenorhabditis nigoni]